MAKTITVSDETYIDLYRIVSLKRHELFKAGTPKNISFEDVLRDMIKTYKEVQE